MQSHYSLFYYARRIMEGLEFEIKNGRLYVEEDQFPLYKITMLKIAKSAMDPEQFAIRIQQNDSMVMELYYKTYSPIDIDFNFSKLCDALIAECPEYFVYDSDTLINLHNVTDVSIKKQGLLARKVSLSFNGRAGDASLEYSRESFADLKRVYRQTTAKNNTLTN